MVQKSVSQLKHVATPCIDDYQSKDADVEVVGELASVCAQMVLKCGRFLDREKNRGLAQASALCHTRIGRPFFKKVEMGPFGWLGSPNFEK